MSIIAKICSADKKLPNRFLKGFMPMGAVKREPRANTTNELINSITAYAKDNSDIAEFAQHIKEMNLQHLGLAHDIIDLSYTKDMLPTNINLNMKTETGETVVGRILKMLPDISKRNPGAIELTEEVINNSDTTNAKYFLQNLFCGNDLANLGHLSDIMKSIKGLVPQIAEQTLNSGYTMDYSKEKNFFKIIADFCRSDAKPENINMLTKVIDIINDICKKSTPSINGTDVAIGNPKVIKENMAILPELLKNAETNGQSIDVSGFLTKNINLD